MSGSKTEAYAVSVAAGVHVFGFTFSTLEVSFRGKHEDCFFLWCVPAQIVLAVEMWDTNVLHVRI